MNRVMFPARKFGITDDMGTISRWDPCPAKSFILKKKDAPLWLRYLLSEAVSAFRWLSKAAEYKDILIEKINVKDTVGEFMNMLLYGKAGSLGCVMKKIQFAGDAPVA